jgi:hypothetical protein
MMQRLTLLSTILFCIGISAFAQKPKSKVNTTTKKNAATTQTNQKQLSNAEKMPYSRANKYYGPGTFYCYAPGKPNNKMANNKLSAMRDLTGISAVDLYTELAKQGFVKVPENEEKRWFNPNNSKDAEYFYPPDKSYIMQTGITGLSLSPAPDGYGFKVSNGVLHWVLVPKEDTAKVMEAIWQFLRDLHELKANLVSIESKYKKSREGVYPFEQVGFAGWSNFRAGSWVQVMENGKLTNKFEKHETILRRTIANPGFDMWITGMETDFGYGMHVMLKKEGYMLYYNMLARNICDLVPGQTWQNEYPDQVRENKIFIQNDKNDIEQYKGKLPPNFGDLDQLLHITK